MLRALGRKLIQGLATSFATVSIAGLFISTVATIDGSWNGFGIDAMLRVGIPSFIAGIVFFPVNEKTLASRVGFSARAAVAAAGSSLAHRALLWSFLNGPEQTWFEESWLQTLKHELIGLGFVLSNPSLLIPQSPFEPTLLLALGAIALAAVAGYKAQPGLLRIARGPSRRMLHVGPSLDDSEDRPAHRIRQRG